MNAPHRRNACPGLSTPMPTGDGLLARFLPAGRMALDAFTSFCDAAHRHGNGTIEVTARGSMQVRGLTPRSAPMLAGEIAALHIAADGLPVITNPLSEDDAKIDTTALTVNLRRAIADARLALAPKVSIVIDGGSPLHLDALTADVRLGVIKATDGSRIHIALGGDAATAMPLGTATPEETPEIVMRLLRVIASSRNGRAADILRDEGIGAFRAVIEPPLDPAPPLPQRAPAEPVGRHQLCDGSFAFGVGLAFGHTDAEALAQLTDVRHTRRTLGAAGARTCVAVRQRF